MSTRAAETDMERAIAQKRPRSTFSVAIQNTLREVSVPSDHLASNMIKVHGVAFDTTTIGNASKLLEWLQGHPLTRYHDGFYSIIGMLMIMEGITREAAYDRKRYLISKAKKEDVTTPLANYEEVIGGDSVEIFIEWNAFRTLWLPLLKGPLANLYQTKVIRTGENGRAVIEQGVGIVDERAVRAGLPVFVPPPYQSAQLTYEHHKKMLYHQHMVAEAKKDAESKREKEKRADEKKLLIEQKQLATIESKDARLFEQLNTERRRLIHAETRIDQLEKRNEKLCERIDDMQQKLDAKDRTLDHFRQLVLQ